MNGDHHPVGRPSGESRAELLPCPWGCESEIGHRVGKDTLRHVCMVCGAEGPAIEANAETAEAWNQAGAAWNRRPPDRSLLDRIEELEGVLAPFVRFARVRDDDPEMTDQLTIASYAIDLRGNAVRVTLGDFRRARKALSGEKP